MQVFTKKESITLKIEELKEGNNFSGQEPRMSAGSSEGCVITCVLERERRKPPVGLQGKRAHVEVESSNSCVDGRKSVNKGVCVFVCRVLCASVKHLIVYCHLLPLHIWCTENHPLILLRSTTAVEKWRWTGEGGGMQAETDQTGRDRETGEGKRDS